MTLLLTLALLRRIGQQGEGAYPEETAGFLLGQEGDERIVQDIVPVQNARDERSRHNRYLIGTHDYLRAELQAEKQGMDVVGIYHSHPDHPERPSEHDREWAQPNLSYLITNITAGKPGTSRSWRLLEDRSGFAQEEIRIT